MTIETKPAYGSVIAVESKIAQAYQVFFDDLQRLLNENLLGPSIPLPQHTVGTLPAQQRGAMIYVTDEAGGEVMAFSDGLVWRRVTDRAIVS